MVKHVDLENASKGSWNPIENKTSRVENNKGKIITIIALVAIGSIAGGALLIYFQVNALTGWCLIGAGGFLTAADFVIGIYLCRPKIEDPVGNAEYNVVSWDVSNLEGYKNVRAIRSHWRKTVEGALNRLRKSEKPYVLTEKDLSKRTELLKQTFAQFKLKSVDIICLQETSEFETEELENLLPKKFHHFSYANEDGKECTVVWNSNRLKLVNTTSIQYDEESLRSKNLVPNTIVLLEDINNRAKICVDSAHMREFDLSSKKTPKGSPERNTQGSKVRGGDNQVIYDLATMDLVDADIYLIAGNLSATREHCKSRFEILEAVGYVENMLDLDPTVYDLNLKEPDGKPTAVRVDHIFVKSRLGGNITIVDTNIETTPLDNFKERASEHLPISAKITFTA